MCKHIIDLVNDETKLTIAMIVNDQGLFVRRHLAVGEEYTASGKQFNHEADCASEFYAQVGKAILDGYRCQDITDLALECGSILRLLDPAGDYAEWWTMDGDYIPDIRFPGY